MEDHYNPLLDKVGTIITNSLYQREMSINIRYKREIGQFVKERTESNENDCKKLQR